MKFLFLNKVVVWWCVVYNTTMVYFIMYHCTVFIIWNTDGVCVCGEVYMFLYRTHLKYIHCMHAYVGRDFFKFSFHMCCVGTQYKLLLIYTCECILYTLASTMRHHHVHSVLLYSTNQHYLSSCSLIYISSDVDVVYM